MDSSLFDMAETARRLANMVQLGAIAEADYANARVKVRMGDMVSAWLPWVTARAGGNRTWDAPEVGEQVMILSPSGNPAQGVVLGAIYQQAYAAPETEPGKHHTVYQDGAVIEYDRDAHHLKAVLPAGATVELIADGGINFTGDLTVTGNITATGNITDSVRSMAADRTIYNGHVHPGVEPGGGSTSATGQTQ